jgi:hypothetical protein
VARRALTVAVLQSNYIPWKGYFDLIHDVDLFIFLDDVQYTKSDWRNRNRIKTPAGPEWLTIPVGPRDNLRICDVALPTDGWASRHLRRLQATYQSAPFFGLYRGFLEDVYGKVRSPTLSEFNRFLIGAIARDFLGIETELADSRSYPRVGRRQDGLLEILRQVGATIYLSGPAGRDYLEVERFAEAGIELRWKDYRGYPEYPQLHPPFLHQVTILDLLFHVGPRAPELIWGWRRP